MFAPAILYPLMDLTAKSNVVHGAWCMDSHLDPLLVLMIVTPHLLHTHSRSSFYIYKVFEHLQQWLRVIRVSLRPDICSHGPKSDFFAWIRTWNLC